MARTAVPLRSSTGIQTAGEELKQSSEKSQGLDFPYPEEPSDKNEDDQREKHSEARCRREYTIKI